MQKKKGRKSSSTSADVTALSTDAITRKELWRQSHFFFVSFFCLGRRETRPFPLFRCLMDLVFNRRARTHRNATPGACFPPPVFMFTPFTRSSIHFLRPISSFVCVGRGKKGKETESTSLWSEHSSSFTFQSHRIHSVAPPTTEVLNALDPPPPTNQPTNAKTFRLQFQVTNLDPCQFLCVFFFIGQKKKKTTQNKTNTKKKSVKTDCASFLIRHVAHAQKEKRKKEKKLLSTWMNIFFQASVLSYTVCFYIKTCVWEKKKFKKKQQKKKKFPPLPPPVMTFQNHCGAFGEFGAVTALRLLFSFLSLYITDADRPPTHPPTHVAI